MNYIDILCEMQPDSFTPVIEKIDEVITDIVAIASARQTREEQPDETTPVA
ncbi:hypothetical protein JW960_00530 [candidate division KSB1 bacterium]|nr:hypothetical protein [candidate division KSB1 bacterium]